MKIAFEIRELESWASNARLYRVIPPLKHDDELLHYIIVSSVTVLASGPETYIFSSDETGVAKSYLELPGSYRGGLDHEVAINNMGYTLLK